MGADERLFGPQRAAGLDFEAPALPMPERGDTMAAYARRIRDQLRLEEPCVVGGVSFGGMVAYELARITDAQRVLLVASCSTPRALPHYYRLVEWVSRLIPDCLIRRRTGISARMMARIERLTEEQIALIRAMADDTEVEKLRRIARMILTWDAPATCPCPVHHIHGGRDLIIPLSKIQPEVVIPNGGHLINLTYPGDVNAFMDRHLGY